MSFDIPLLMVIIFLLCTTVIVCCSISQFTSFRMYAVGNRQFSTASLVVTTLATYYGGATLVGNLTKFDNHPFWLTWRLANILMPYLLLSWLSIKLSKFIYHISMAETIGRVYGKYPRVITALLSCFYSITLVATQIHILSDVISACINSINPLLVTLATVMLIAYTIFGGARTVVLTDIWQLITSVSFICLFVWFMVIKVNHPISEIPVLKKNLSINLFFSSFTKYKLIFTLYYLSAMFYFLEPGSLQHLYMSSTPDQAKKVFLYAGIIGFLIMLFFIAAGALVAAWIPPNLPQEQVFNYIFDHMPALLKGVLCVCFLAFSMSTADSRLHISAVMISYDVVGVLLPMRFRKNLSCRRYYNIAFMSILIVILVAIVLCLNNNCLSTFRYIAKWIMHFYIPIVAAPFILTAVRFRITSSTALIGMAAGALSVFLWRKPFGDASIFLSVLTNGLTMLVVHYALTKIKSYKKNRPKKVSYDTFTIKK